MGKVYNIMYGVGSLRYVVNFHDGVKTHSDGSLFFDIAIYSNKRKMQAFINCLRKIGYREVN